MAIECVGDGRAVLCKGIIEMVLPLFSDIDQKSGIVCMAILQLDFLCTTFAWLFGVIAFEILFGCPFNAVIGFEGEHEVAMGLFFAAETRFNVVYGV